MDDPEIARRNGIAAGKEEHGNRVCLSNISDNRITVRSMLLSFHSIRRLWRYFRERSDTLPVQFIRDDSCRSPACLRTTFIHSLTNEFGSW